MKRQAKSYGYYHITVNLPGGHKIMHTNNERAFVVSQLQDLLSPRLLIGSIPAHKQLSSCIDLLAFSITSESVQLIAFSIDSEIISQFVSHILGRLSQYQNEYQTRFKYQPEPQTIIKKLLGPHQALARSSELHIGHEDWEYDRYSSIGFYLHDRRGDWMRIWRLSNLYNNDTENYRQLLEARIKTTSLRSGRSMLQSFAS